MNVKEVSIFEQALQSAETIFLHPSVVYPYENIMQGVSVNGTQKKAVDLNTYGNFYEKAYKCVKRNDGGYICEAILC